MNFLDSFNFLLDNALLYFLNIIFDFRYIILFVICFLFIIGFTKCFISIIKEKNKE